MRRHPMLALITVIAVASFASFAVGQQSSKQTQMSPSRSDLEKELWEIDQKWRQAAQTKNFDYLNELWTDQFFEILPKGQVVSKSELLGLLSKIDRTSGFGASLSDFKLAAVYGDFAIATDHTTATGLVVDGRSVQEGGRYQSVRFFVKDNGKWRVAGAAFVPITSQ